ncbi:MAG TPA: hypothetical protein VHD60_01900 [Candidatus Saccharimonadales bacterium]|nr:hypothetical protein [Candidatus Saccharimonadales bacterium]
MDNPEAGDRRIADSPRYPVGFRLPRPLDEKVKDLVDLANRVGERTTRTEMFSAIIYRAVTEPDSISSDNIIEILHGYRLATIADLENPPDESQPL